MSTPAQVPDLAAQVAILTAQVDALIKIVTDGFIEGGKEDQIPLVLRPAAKVATRPGLRLVKS